MPLLALIRSAQVLANDKRKRISNRLLLCSLQDSSLYQPMFVQHICRHEKLLYPVRFLQTQLVKKLCGCPVFPLLICLRKLSVALPYCWAT